MSGCRRVVLSATMDPSYSFSVPLTALVWRRVARFHPLLLLIGTPEEWRSDRRTSVVLAEASHHGDVVFVPHRTGIPDHTLAQVVRLCGAALSGADDDYLLVSDIDMWPLTCGRYQAGDPLRAFQIINADAYGDDPDRFPMCYLGGRRDAWREIFSLDGDLDAALAMIPWPADGDWHFDERYATACLRAAPDFADWCELLARLPGPDHGRLDRVAWRLPDALGNLVDAHLPRPGFTEDHWPLLEALLHRLLPPDELSIAVAYHHRYIEASLVDRNDDGLDRAFRLWFRQFALVAPEPYRSYGGYGDGEPNGTACSLEAIRAFARLVVDPNATVLNAGAGASSFLLRKLFRNVVCADSNLSYLDTVRRICISHGLNGDGFIVGLENAPDADYTFFDYGEMAPNAPVHDYALAYRKTRHAIYYDDADDRPHGFPEYRGRLREFAASQGVTATDCLAATDAYGRWGIILRKAPTPSAPGVISFSLWGADPLYLHGAVYNLQAAADHYPGFRVRIYTDDPNALDEAVCSLASDVSTNAQSFAAHIGVPLEVIPMPANVGIRGMFWRFLAASDQHSDPILIRDCDSRLNPREAAAVTEWLMSGRKFHVMHDHANHAGWPMLGGMWGVRGGVLTDMEQRIAAWGVWDAKPDDMRFLAASVWPEAKCDLFHHSSVLTEAPAMPFPSHAPCAGFVGQIVPIEQ